MRRENANLREENEIFKKNRCLLREESAIAKFVFIHEHRERFRIARMCQVLNASKRGYYRGYICSMSRKGNCYDNAPMESVWGKLKNEWLYGRKFRTRQEAKMAVFEYSELFLTAVAVMQRMGI